MSWQLINLQINGNILMDFPDRIIDETTDTH